MDEFPCEFCIEIERPEESYFYKLFSKRDIKSRILYEDSTFIAVPGLGSLTEGYVLILPKEHSVSLSHLSPESLNELDHLKKQLLGFMKGAYGNIFCFEHGAVSN